MMDDEFDKLMALLSGESEEKEKRLDEIFQKCTEFFEKYKYILTEGSSDEKEAVQAKMNALRDKIKQENEKAHSDLGILQGDVKNLSLDEKNFTEEQWRFLQKAQEKLFQEKADLEKRQAEDKEKRESEMRLKSKKRPSGRKSGWMKS
jgi:hypothetical protein